MEGRNVFPRCFNRNNFRNFHICEQKKTKSICLFRSCSLHSTNWNIFGRISNFINSELYGKPTGGSWGVVFPNIDNVLRHPSQIYEAILEGLLLFIILNTIIFLKKYSLSFCSSMFLIFYGFFRIVAEQYRVPDQQLGMILDFISMGSLLSSLMIIAGSF